MHERRKHKRVKFGKQCLINHSGNIGEIIDLSLGGVSCWCVHGHLCSLATSRTVDIFCQDMKMWARRLPLQVLESESVTGKFLGGVPVRRCRSRFTELHEPQRAQLENLILKHSTTHARKGSP